MSASGTEERIAAVTLCAGSGAGTLLVLEQPLSFWGGTDRATGMVIDTHHPQRGTLLGGRVLLLDASRGSSSSSSVLAEQLRVGVGPSAIMLTVRDAIICLGVLAAAELYDNQTPVVLLTPLDAERLHALALSNHVSVTAEPNGRAAVVLSPTDSPSTIDQP